MAIVNTITMVLVPADPNHYGDKNGLFIGKMFFLRSASTGEFDGRPYFITEHTDKKEFKAWFKQHMVYEPVSLKDPAVVEQKEVNT